MKYTTSTSEIDTLTAWYASYDFAKLKREEAKEGTRVTSMIGEPRVPDKSLNNKVSIWRGDITTLAIDAIVNAANSSLLGGGGVDGAIHNAAGPELRAECATLGGCQVGDAKISAGHRLPARHIIHTVGPRGHMPQRQELLRNCYQRSLDIAGEKELCTIAFPCISTGIYGYPNEEACHVALNVAREWLEAHPETVDRIIFCIFLEVDWQLYRSLAPVYFPVEAVAKSSE